MRQQAGSVQMIRVSMARTTPPRLYPMSVKVWVDEAPGSSWQKAL